MKKFIALVKVVKDTRRIKNDNSIPLKLRITLKGIRKYYSTGYSVTEQEWNKLNTADVKGKLRDIKIEIASIEKNAQKIIDSIEIFSFKEFEDKFFEKPIKYISVESAFKNYISNLRANNQLGTADSYNTAINSLIKFKPKLQFSDINTSFLKAFEISMLQKEKSITTVGIYLRCLRTILNIAKEDGVVSKDNYPFGNKKYTIPSGKNIKKAIDIKEIKQLFNYEAELLSNKDMAKDFWIFSYLCNGINITDIARLTWKDIDNKAISFTREKTKRSSRTDIIKIVAIRDRHIDNIIKKWGNKSKNQNDYIFNIISSNDTLLEKRKKIQLFTKVLNKWLKRIGEELSFDLKLTTYVARHSFATILMRDGAPLELIRQSLGHSNLLTTQKYLGTIDLETQSRYTKALTDF